MVQSKITEYKERRKDIATKIIKTGLNPQKNRTIYTEINDHFQKSLNDCIEYFKQLKEDTSIILTDHMPILYCIKIWNYMVSNLWIYYCSLESYIDNYPSLLFIHATGFILISLSFLK